MEVSYTFQTKFSRVWSDQGLDQNCLAIKIHYYPNLSNIEQTPKQEKWAEKYVLPEDWSLVLISRLSIPSFTECTLRVKILVLVKIYFRHLFSWPLVILSKETRGNLISLKNQ